MRSGGGAGVGGLRAGDKAGAAATEWELAERDTQKGFLELCSLAFEESPLLQFSMASSGTAH